MLSFKQFIVEDRDFTIPIAHIEKSGSNLADKITRQELNHNLALTVNGNCMNPYSAWIRSSKVLSLFGITLPKVLFHDLEVGEEIVHIDQFGAHSGAELNGTIEKVNSVDEVEYYFYFSYEMKDNGYYDIEAMISDENELDDFLSSEEPDTEEE
jgi:hypothetical protein